MSTAILTGLIGVGGTLLGLFAERWFQRLGKIRCTFGELFVNTYNTSGVEHKGGLPVDRKALEGLAYEVGAHYEINVKLFNEKYASTGLRDVVLQFVSADGSVVLEDSPDVSEVSGERGAPTRFVEKPLPMLNRFSTTAFGAFTWLGENGSVRPQGRGRSVILRGVLAGAIGGKG